MTAPTTPPEIPVTFVGHPFATVGMGEQLRSHLAACRAVNLPHRVLDIFRYANRTDPDYLRLMADCEAQTPGAGIRIFHINGDEVERAIEAFEARGGKFSDGYNIIVPAWELPRYPETWATQLRKFDEVWALSDFIAGSLTSVNVSSILIGQAVEVPLGYFLPRRFFGIRESAFALLHFFDLTSYTARKNPEAVLAMFQAIRRHREFADIQIVLKVKSGEQDGEEWLQPLRDRLPEAVCLAKPMNAFETRSLINSCNCFVSLHRAEGFGRGTAEAMFLGRLALATGWSGNLDYMTTENSLMVDYQLVPVGADQSPFGDGQIWAEPDIDHAVALLKSVMDDPDRARAIAARGRRDIRLGHGFRAVGIRILNRVSEIRGLIQGRPKSQSRIGHKPARRARRKSVGLDFEQVVAQ